MKTLDEEIQLDLRNFSEDIKSLIPGLISTNTMSRQRSREKLEKIGPMVLDEISRLLESKQEQLRWEIAKALENMASIGSIPILLKLMADEESDIRWIAAQGLINIGRNSLFPLLLEIIYNDSTFLNESAHHVLMELLTNKEKKDYDGLLKALKNSKEVNGIAVIRAKEILDSYSRSGAF